MFQEIGQRIRILRKQKGIGLNTFAANLGVSPGYLSNLETGKTDTIQLSLLESIDKELTLFPTDDTDLTQGNEFDFRVKRNSELIKKLQKSRPAEAEYLISIFEQGIDLFNKDL